jgi:hypothetical protein
VKSADLVAVEIIEALQRAKISCAIGGAIAFGFWGGARATTGADMNAFVEPDRYEELLSVLERAGCAGDRARALEQARGGDTIVLWKDDGRVDVFVPTIPFYKDAEKNVRVVPLLGRQVPVLGPEATCVFKLLFFRSKDLLDLENLVALQKGQLDHGWVRRWIVEMLGEADERVAKWDEIVRTHGPR